MVAAAVLLGCTAVLGIVIGSTSVGIDDVLALAFGADADQTAANVIWNIRLPRSSKLRSTTPSPART